MDHSELERRQPDRETDWEKAFLLFKDVVESNNEVLQVQATLKLARLSKHAPESIVACTVPILVELVSSPLSSTSPSICEASVYCLKCITCRREGKLAAIIGQSNVIPSLLTLLQDSVGSLQIVILKCLRNLVTYADSNRVIVVRSAGLEIILNILRSCPEGLKCLLLEILSALALLREVRRVIVSLGGIGFLVESARCGSIVSRTRAAQAIGSLALARRVRRKLVDAGAIQVLMELLQNGDTPTKLVAGNALGVISSHIDYIRRVAQAGAIPLYMELLQGPDPIGKDIAEDVFCVLAVAEENAVTIAEQLVNVLRGGDDEAKAAAADVLWDLSSYKHSLSVVHNSGAIPILVELLTNGCDDVREKISGAVAQLSYNEGDRLALVEAGAIPRLIDMLQDESEEQRDNAAEALGNFSEDPSLRERMSDAINTPWFEDMLNRLPQIRASEAHMATMSLRQMSQEQLTWDLFGFGFDGFPPHINSGHH